MRAFIDTNVIVDVVAKREPFFADSQAILALCAMGEIEGIVSDLTFCNVAYVLRRKSTSLSPEMFVISKTRPYGFARLPNCWRKTQNNTIQFRRDKAASQFTPRSFFLFKPSLYVGFCSHSNRNCCCHANPPLKKMS